MRVSTRGDYASRALLSLALHGARERRPRSGTSRSGPGSPSPTSSRSSWPSRAPAWCAPNGASEAATSWPASPEDISLAQIVSAVDGPIAGRRLRRAPCRRGLRPRGPVRAARRVGRCGRDHPHPPAVLQPGRHGGPGPGQRDRRRIAATGGQRRLSPRSRSGPHVPMQHHGRARAPIPGCSPSRWPRTKSRPATGGSPSQRAASTRRTCPWATHRVSPSTCRARSMTRSTRRPTSAARSPSTTPSFHRVQPGRSAADLGRGQPLVGAVVPLHQIRARARPSNPARAQVSRGPLQRAGQHLGERHAAEELAGRLRLLTPEVEQRNIRPPVC